MEYKTYVYKRKKMTLTQLEQLSNGVSRAIIRQRIERDGYTVAEAVETKLGDTPKSRKKKAVTSKTTKSLPTTQTVQKSPPQKISNFEYWKQNGIGNVSKTAFYERLKKGLSLKEAVK